MIILLEEYSYNLMDERVIKALCGIGINWTHTRTGKVSLNYVGYFYNPELNDCVFILPKVLLEDVKGDDGTIQERVFGHYKPEDIIYLDKLEPGKIKEEERKFIYEFAVWIYRAIVVYQKDNKKSSIIEYGQISQISRTRKRRTNTMLDVVLSLIDFAKDHQDFITFTLKNIHSGHNKINWTRTISRSQAILQDGAPIYLNPVNKKRQINFDEELLIIFYSILHYIKEKYGFQVNINLGFELIKGAKFESYINGRGKIRLRQIKYKYFSDIALEMWELCNAFFDRSQNIHASTQLNDFLLVKNFYIVFEAIIDKLIGSDEEKRQLNQKLTKQEDGKLVDHLYTYSGLMEAGDRDVSTYYIGDSKYYKMGHALGDESIYKQHTYARNVIQHNIDCLLNEKPDQKVKLRDDQTEGYNVVPNFFISADMDSNEFRYDNNKIERRPGGTQISYQFHDRLFDRDTLLLSHYNVNFLFVIALYARNNRGEINAWMKKVRDEFRKEIQRVLKANYVFYVLRPKDEQQIEAWIQVHFKEIQGKIFRPYENESLYIFALEKSEAQYALHEKKKPLEEISESAPTSKGENLLKQLENAFVVKEVDEQTKALDLAIEHASCAAKYVLETAAGGVDAMTAADTLPRYYLERYPSAELLIGACKGDRYMDWIVEQMQYNVRIDETREGGFKRSDLTKHKPKFIIVYDYDTYAYRVFVTNSEKGKPISKEEMQNRGYPEAKSDYYYLYALQEEVNVGDLDISKIVNAYWTMRKLTPGTAIFTSCGEFLEVKNKVINT